MIAFYLLLFISIIRGARDCTNENMHTNAYNIYKEKHSLSELFILKTFGGFLKMDPCTPFTGDYRKLLIENGITCEGKWCGPNNGFNCTGTNTECYHIEHIIDKTNSGIEGDKLIIGNLIMAYGRWNVQIGQLCWPSVMIEKGEIYGGIFDMALDNVRKCNEAKFDVFGDHVQLWVLILVAMMLFIVCVGIIVYCIQVERCRCLSDIKSYMIEIFYTHYLRYQNA